MMRFTNAWVGLLLIGLSHALPAQTYPTKPIRILVQFTPGTSTDILARLIAQKMSENWGQQVIVDNRPGAGAVVGTVAARNATPDGYTLVMAVSSAFGINQPDVKERLATLAFTPVGGTRAEFTAYIKSEIEKWGKAVKESGAKAD